MAGQRSEERSVLNYVNFKRVLCCGAADNAKIILQFNRQEFYFAAAVHGLTASVNHILSFTEGMISTEGF